MSQETNNSSTHRPTKRAFSAKRIIASALGFAALACVVTAAVFGWHDPLVGAILLAIGVVAAVVVFFLGLFLLSSIARRLAELAIFAAVLVAVAGVAAVLFNKNFEDRCVAIWEKITQMSETVERRIERVEDRFESVAD